MSKTGRLEKVEIRNHWPNEERDFTPWMVEEGGLDILADALGLKLEDAEGEVNVGPFRADILCRNTADGSDVIIENQYGISNHDHIRQTPDIFSRFRDTHSYLDCGRIP